jgi:hypothetical protein
MTPEQFAYWLQGFAELNEDQPTPEQWASIREHLATVFTKETPPIRRHGRPPTTAPLFEPFDFPPTVTC